MEAGKTDIHYHLVEKARKNDRESQFELYKLYSRGMLNVSCRIVGNVEEAEDVLQESFTSAFNKIHNYRGDSTFGSWLKRIVVNNSLTIIKKRKFEMSDVDELGEEDFNHDDTEYREDELDIDKVKSAINLLPKGFKMVLSLYLLEGYDHKEIGEIMNISESTSKSQFNRAKKKLRMILKEQYDYER